LQVLQEVLGLEGEWLWTAASGFGGGIGRVQLVCGALTGAVIALGLAEGKSTAEPGPKTVSDPVRPKVRQLVKGFEDEFGSTECRALVGFDFSSPEEYEAFRASKEARAGCESYIRYAVQEVASRWGNQRGEG
jgi:C_GCAxxG_C_C family probable redox protein